MDECDYQKAEDHHFIASQIDHTDVTLWFQLASASVKLGHYHTVRVALEENLNCSPNHWLCLEQNLIAFSFKLLDNYGCLCYCAMAVERDPNNQKAIEYKSKVYQEMPFMKEYMKDEDFVCIPVEREYGKLFNCLKSLEIKKIGNRLVFCKAVLFCWRGKGPSRVDEKNHKKKKLAIMGGVK